MMSNVIRVLSNIVKEIAYVRDTIDTVAKNLGINLESASISIEPRVGNIRPDALIIEGSNIFAVEYLRKSKPLHSIVKKLVRYANEAEKIFKKHRKFLVVVFYERVPRQSTIGKLIDLLGECLKDWSILILDNALKKYLRKL